MPELGSNSHSPQGSTQKVSKKLNDQKKLLQNAVSNSRGFHLRQNGSHIVSPKAQRLEEELGGTESKADRTHDRIQRHRSKRRQEHSLEDPSSNGLLSLEQQALPTVKKDSYPGNRRVSQNVNQAHQRELKASEIAAIEAAMGVTAGASHRIAY